jgi:integrase
VSRPWSTWEICHRACSTDARDLREIHVEQFIYTKLQTLSPAFVRGCINVLNKALRRLRRDHPDVPRLELDTAEIFERAEDSGASETRAIDSWTHDEAAAILRLVHANEPRWYLFILSLLHTGCRRGEVLGWKWPDTDFDQMQIAIRRARVHGQTVLPKMRKKRDKPRTVVITPAMEVALRGLQTFRHRGSRSWIFQTRTGRPIDGTTVQRVWDPDQAPHGRRGHPPVHAALAPPHVRDPQLREREVDPLGVPTTRPQERKADV